MALFDFLKKRKKKEKEEVKKAARVDKDGSASEAASTEQQKSFREISQSDNFVLESPHVTERARMLSEKGQYIFRVLKDASSRQVRESVERLYGVHVTKVRIIKVHEKPRRRGLTEGVKKGYKKAVVALKKGETIDIF